MSHSIRIFIIECVDPMDLLQKRSESKALKQVCELIGHEVAIMTAYSKSDFEKYCHYISSIDVEHDRENRKKIPLCIHITSHGNEDGIGFGSDFIDWSELFATLNPIFTKLNNYDGNVFLVLSSCDAGSQKLSSKITNGFQNGAIQSPPPYIFVTNEEGIYWQDALVAWTLFYHKISSLNIEKRMNIRGILSKVKKAVGTELKYFRWDRGAQTYKTHVPK